MTTLCLSLVLFLEHPYFDKKYKYRQHRGMIQIRSMPVINHNFIYIYYIEYTYYINNIYNIYVEFYIYIHIYNSTTRHL